MSTLWQREEITQEDFRTAFEQARQQQRQAMGEAFDPREFESADNKRIRRVKVHFKHEGA